MFSSSHPLHIKESIPYSQFLRLRRICSEDENFIDHCIEICRHFLRRGYPTKVLAKGLLEAASRSREDLLHEAEEENKQKRNNEDKLFVLETYQPNCNILKNTIQKNWHILSVNKSTKEIANKRIVFGYRRSPNIKDKVVHTKLVYPPPNKLKTRIRNQLEHACRSPGTCKYCNKLDKSGTITSTHTMRKHKSMKNVTCRSSNLIYCITCQSCGIQYVGETKNTLMTRFQSHFWHINCKKTETPVGIHFNKPGHKGIHDVKIHVLDFIHANPATSLELRLKTEKRWIHRLRTSEPLGLNSMD